MRGMQVRAPWGAARMLAALGAVLLAGCGQPSPEDARAASAAKCERQFGRLASDPTKGAALCDCVVDRLAGEGLEITDMLGSERAKVEGIMRSCAQSTGVRLPQ